MGLGASVMYVRLATQQDLPAMLEMGENHCKELLPDREWSKERSIARFNAYFDTGNPIFYVAVGSDKELLGYLSGFTANYNFMTGFYAVFDIIYVRPDKRGHRAAAQLINTFNQWADRLQANEVVFLAGDDRVSPRTLSFIQRFGYSRAGLILRRTVRR